VAIKDTAAGLWLQANGNWATQYATLTATLTSPGATSTTWSYTWTPAVAGSYGVSVVATDASGNVDLTKPWVTFTLQ
jgi:hypothetical protein